MVASPARNGRDLIAPVGADEKIPASHTARVRYREGIWVFVGEAKPASVMPRARVGGRFVLLIVAMTRLTCFRRKPLLGRNLITLFRCVNSFAKIFSAPPRPLSRHQVGENPRFAPVRARRLSNRGDVAFKNAAFNAVFLWRRFGIAGYALAIRAAPACRCDAFPGVNGRISGIAANRSFGRRTSPNARICANFFGRRTSRPTLRRRLATRFTSASRSPDSDSGQRRRTPVSGFSLERKTTLTAVRSPLVGMRRMGPLLDRTPESKPAAQGGRQRMLERAKRNQ